MDGSDVDGARQRGRRPTAGKPRGAPAGRASRPTAPPGRRWRFRVIWSTRVAAVHQDEFPKGAWWEERETYAILALAASGKQDEAKSRAEALFLEAPDTQHRRRIEAALKTPPR
jgi:hypothetical protein